MFLIMWLIAITIKTIIYNEFKKLSMQKKNAHEEQKKTIV